MSDGEFWLPNGEILPSKMMPYYRCFECDVLGIGVRCWCCGSKDVTRHADHRWPVPQGMGGQEVREFRDSDDSENIDGALFVS